MQQLGAEILNIYDFPNTRVPSIAKPTSDYGSVAALRLFDDLKARVHRAYFTPSSVFLNNAVAQGVGPNEYGNIEFVTNLAKVGHGHYQIVIDKRMPVRYSLNRINLKKYDLDSFSDILSYYDLNAAATAMTNIERHFLYLGQSFGINPSLVKAAFVQTLKNRYLLNPPTNFDPGYNVSPDALFENMDRLWGVAPVITPANYYKNFGPFNEAGGKMRARKRKRKGRSRRYY